MALMEESFNWELHPERDCKIAEVQLFPGKTLSSAVLCLSCRSPQRGTQLLLAVPRGDSAGRTSCRAMQQPWAMQSTQVLAAAGGLFLLMDNLCVLHPAHAAFSALLSPAHQHPSCLACLSSGNVAQCSGSQLVKQGYLPWVVRASLHWLPSCGVFYGAVAFS